MNAPFRTLLVEDEPTTRLLLEEALFQRGHEVTTFAEAESALLAHEAHPFSFMMLDWILPGMDGLELCRKVRAMPGGDAVLIVMVTGRNRQEDLEAVLAAGANDYLAKPLDFDQLMTRIAIAEHRLQEIVQRKQAEGALRSSEGRIRALLNAIPDQILRLSRKGTVKDFHQGEAKNPLALPDPRIGSQLEEWLPADQARRALQYIASTLDTGTLQRFEFQLSGDKSMQYFESRLVVSSPDEVLATIQNITEKKQMEARLMLADRMVSLGTLSAGLAHEINNPLAYIMTNLDFLAEELHNIVPTGDRLVELREVIQEAREGANRVRQIVRDLKSFSRQDEHHIGPVDLTKVLNSAANMAWNEIRHRARLVKNFGETPPVESNEARLSQVFINLLVNAAQAIPEGTAQDNLIEIVTRTEGKNHVLVEVRDTGSGIPAEILDRIFDPFFTTKAIGQGTGLGLAVCHSIVTSLGGDISVQSAMGKGTCFRVTLPVKTSSEKTAEKTPTQAASPQKLQSHARILIVDDEPNIAQAIRRILRGYEVTIATNGRQAVELCRKEDFALVLCDLMMPDLTGMDVYEQLKQLRPGMEKRMLFMSGGTFTKLSKEFLSHIPNRWIEKPFDNEVLHKLVQESLKQP